MNKFGDVLMHHGILGQKWGVRRYQNPDGSLTDAGKKRYNKIANKNETMSKGFELYRMSSRPLEEYGQGSNTLAHLQPRTIRLLVIVISIDQPTYTIMFMKRIRKLKFLLSRTLRKCLEKCFKIRTMQNA